MSEQRVGLKAVISADMTKFAATMRNASMVAKKTAEKISGGMRSVSTAMLKAAANAAKLAAKIAAVGTTIAAAFTARNIKAAYDMGGALSDMSAQTGIAVKELAILQRAFEDNGVAGDKVGSIVNKMQRSISDLGAELSTQIRAFDRLGLTFEGVAAKTPLEQFRMVQERIASIENPTIKAATAMEIFGRSGGEMLTLFSDSNAIPNAVTSLGSAADILHRNAQTFDRISDLLSQAGAKIGQVTLGLAEMAAPKILEALERFNSIDFAGIGERLVRGLNINNVLALMSTAFSVAAAHLGNSVVNSLARAVYIFSDMWSQRIWEMGRQLEASIGRALESAANMFFRPLGMVTEVFDAAKTGREAGRAMGEGVTEFLSRTDPFNMQAAVSRMEEVWGKIMKDGAGPSQITSMPSPSPSSLGAILGDNRVFKDSAAGKALENSFGSDPEVIARAIDDLNGNIRYSKPVSDSAQSAAMAISAAATRMAGHHKAGFSGLAGLQQMQLQRLQGDRVGMHSRLTGRRSLGLGIGSRLTTGGLGEKRAVGRRASEEDLRRQTELAKSSEEHLIDIKTKLESAVSVS